jgi:hypothetical protein
LTGNAAIFQPGFKRGRGGIPAAFYPSEKTLFHYPGKFALPSITIGAIMDFLLTLVHLFEF